MNQNERKTVARRMILRMAVACVIMGLYVMRLILPLGDFAPEDVAEMAEDFKV